ncbi:MAG: beta galactosidase jelly roll domain-containing protein [Planctomycetes bacterium]|nr:beta galactosidase jelly roll domain-containing protein [Planctomycetota bacterium]
MPTTEIASPRAAESKAALSQRRHRLAVGWAVVQDLHDCGEAMGIWKADFTATIGTGLSPWQPIPRLEHLQRLLSEQPWYGRQLHAINEHAWWYRLLFTLPAGFGPSLRLRFDGVDQYATVWLNGVELGRHEGYADGFSFAIDDTVRRDAENVLVVRVDAPWDREVDPAEPMNRVGAIIRNQIKGTYEHADTFVQRDVNPIGIHAPVWLDCHQGVSTCSGPRLQASTPAPGMPARVTARWDVDAVEAVAGAVIAMDIIDLETGRRVDASEMPVRIPAGASTIVVGGAIPAPKRWSTWDRGTPSLYRARLTLRVAGEDWLVEERTFGIRDVELVRDERRTELVMDGQRVFLRATTYFPDIYVSAMDRGRWRRDLEAMVAYGFNAVRVHVHQQPDGFYDECDRLGLLVLQDSDLNWRFPADDPAFVARAETLFGRMIRRLGNHPSIFAWVCMNETLRTEPYLALGRRLAALARAEDPTRSTIVNSWQPEDPASGDSHRYAGALDGGRYTDMADRTYKLLSEFGVDAPATPSALRAAPGIAERVESLAPHIAGLHDYQYRLIKFHIERLRIAKWNPCGGYFHFMWIDLCPQSFYGVYDHWGRPKAEGLGGGLRAFDEGNRPIAVVLEHLDRPKALWVVNDLARDLGTCRVEWTATTGDGEVVAEGARDLDVAADACIRVCDLEFTVDPEQTYGVVLQLRDAHGAVIAKNSYVDAFTIPERLPGYPARMDHELGMRLWNA